MHLPIQGCLLLEDHLVEAVDLARGAKARGSALHTHIREERGREGRREGWREEGMEGEREGGREGGRERGRAGGGGGGREGGSE